MHRFFRSTMKIDPDKMSKASSKDFKRFTCIGKSSGKGITLEVV